jgi:D-serine deaminase-like pyridoxal phosphate-dependent protein
MLADTVDSHDKALWPAGGARTAEEYVREGHSLFDGSISWPVMVLRREALETNLAALAAFCTRHGLDFAPHGKTSMAPALFERQLAAGAWGITVATAQQALVARAAGVRRVLLAHELLDATALAWAADELTRDPGFWFACLVDSAPGVEAAARAGRDAGLAGGLPVLVDVGYPAGRTGVRDAAQARALAELVARTDGVALAGVSAYEGGLTDADAVRAYLGGVRAVAGELRRDGLLAEGAIVTAGGSSWFDLVAEAFDAHWAASAGLRPVLRSGAYLSHDDGIYRERTPFLRIPEEGHLDAALELWAQVVSAPEPGLALAGFGRRDAPVDSGMPVPLRLRAAAAAQERDIRGLVEVVKLDDQHAYLRLEPGVELHPGDLVRFGISHPCTAFDKWRAIPVVDVDDRVVDVVRTYF